MKRLLTLSLFSILILSALSSTVLADGKEANVSVSIMKMDEQSSLLTLILLSVIFVILLVIVYCMLRYITLQHRKRRAMKEKAHVDADEKDYKEEHKEDTSELSMDSEVDKYLKEDEKTVINILRQRDGIVSQATLRIAGNFSKATLSRLLKELEDRNIIKKEKRGKKNLVILK